MSTKPTQPLKIGVVDYFSVLRELEHLHGAINARLIASDGQADLTTDYVAADMGSAAAIAAAFNETNAAINAILAKIRIS